MNVTTRIPCPPIGRPCFSLAQKLYAFAGGTLLVALLGLFLVVPDKPAEAASFDCSKAELPLDKLICQTPELSAKDYEMAAKYKAALAILSPEGQGILREGQRKWLKFVRTYCTSRIGKLADSGNDDARQCLVTEYDARLAGLSFAAVKTGGFVFSRVDDFEIWPSVSGDDSGSRPGFGYCDVEYPRIDDPQTSEAVAWNKRWAEWGDQCAVRHPTTNPEAGNTDIDVGFRINLAQDRFVGITGVAGQYAHGAAHGLELGDGDEQWNLVLPDLRLLSSEDIFGLNSGWQKVVDGRCRAAIAEHLSPEQMAVRSDWDQICNAASGWILSAEGIEISISLADDYYYAAGTATAKIPWRELKPYLRADLPIKLNTE